MSSKRRKLLRSMEAEKAKAMLAAVAEELGREIRVLMNSAIAQTSDEVSASSSEEPDDFYDFTSADYYRIVSEKMGAQFQYLKTRKMREAEATARRSRITKAVIRVRFPDNYILEAKFQSSEKIQDLVDLLMKVVARPDLPFYIYTTPPKEKIKDMSKDFYSAGFAPGAIVYFSYDLPKDSELDGAVGVEYTGPYLRDDILALNGLDLIEEQDIPIYSEPETVTVEVPPAVPEPKPTVKKPAKPKWLKL